MCYICALYGYRFVCYGTCMYVRGKLVGDGSLLLSHGFLESKGLVVDTYLLSHLTGLKTVIFLEESER